MTWMGDRTSFMEALNERMSALADECPQCAWD